MEYTSKLKSKLCIIMVKYSLYSHINNSGISIIFFLIFVQTLKLVYKESEKATFEYEKIRLKRYRYREEEDIY